MHGTIPSSIWQSTSLISLMLDGLSIARKCRMDLYPGLPDSNVYVRDRSLYGTAPACLFDIQTMRTLHFAGNELSG
ncbi:hypothetical protein EON65_27725 [archaeon]|nr:MAG: hypothetical protein EON65_27725 [archaeon]